MLVLYYFKDCVQCVNCHILDIFLSDRHLFATRFALFSTCTMLLIRLLNSISLECIYMCGAPAYGPTQPYRPFGLNDAFLRSTIFFSTSGDSL